MDIIANHSLRALNTMALPAMAEYFCRALSREDIQQALAFARQRRLAINIIGGGSNIILAGDVSGLLIQVSLSGIDITAQEAGTVWVTAGAGEVWHDLVLAMLERQYYGIENLSLIPGLVGAAPVQNIGAYGVELSECFVALEAVEIATGKIVEFSAEDCQFAYRHSIFKAEFKNAYIITAVTLALHRQARVNYCYPSLRAALDSYDPATISPELISASICRIRREKLPDPDLEANVGSFFKNPLISSAQAEALTKRYPDLLMYPQSDGQIKIPAAWLIDQAGWRGRKAGACGVHPQHALVLTHFGSATGRDILELADQITIDIEQRFDIKLEMEPVVIGSLVSLSAG